MIKETFWFQMAVICIVTVAGSLAFKYGVNQLGKIDFASYMTTIFGVPFPDLIELGKVMWNPYISLALILMFVGRILTSAPLSTGGLARFVAIETPITVAGAVIMSRILFGEKMTFPQYAGVALVVVAIYLIELGRTT